MYIIVLYSQSVKNFRASLPFITFFYKKVDKPLYHLYTIEYNYTFIVRIGSCVKRIVEILIGDIR